MRTETPKGWNKRRIGNFSIRIKRVNKTGANLEPLSITKDRGVILQKLKYKKRIATDPHKYIIACDGDFAFDPMSLYYGAIGRVQNIERGLISPDYVVFAVDETINQDYLLQRLRDPLMHAIYELLSETSNSFGKRRRLYWSVFKELEIYLPPLPEQRKIAEILSSVDEAIQATQAVIEQTRRVKEGLLQELLTKGIGHTRFKQTAVGEIPEKWEVKRLDQLATVQRGRFSHRPRNAPHLYGGLYPFVQTGDIGTADDLLLCHSQTLNDEGLTFSRLFPVGTILITIAANIGDVALTTYRVACPDSLVGIIPHEVDALWLLYVLTARKDRLDRNASESAQKNINLQTLKPLLIGTPPKCEQLQISGIISDVSGTIRVAEAKLAILRQIKSGLLQDLLTGRVRVTV